MDKHSVFFYIEYQFKLQVLNIYNISLFIESIREGKIY